MNDSQQVEQTETDSNDTHDNNIVERLLSAEFWLRLVYMLVFFLIISVASYVVVVVVIGQFFLALITGEKNPKILQFSKSLSVYISEIILFLSQNTDEKPFPFKDWPE